MPPVHDVFALLKQSVEYLRLVQFLEKLLLYVVFGVCDEGVRDAFGDDIYDEALDDVEV